MTLYQSPTKIAMNLGIRGYYEAAKWVARLRARKTDKNTLIYYTEMKAGHGGPTGLSALLIKIAEELIFVLHSIGLIKHFVK